MYYAYALGRSDMWLLISQILLLLIKLQLLLITWTGLCQHVIIVFLGVWRNASRCRVEPRCWKLAIIFWKHFWPTKFDYSLSCREWENDRSNSKLYKVNGLWITISDLIDVSSQWIASCPMNRLLSNKRPHDNCLKILRDSQTEENLSIYSFSSLITYTKGLLIASCSVSSLE